MPTPSEHKTVQARILAYADGIRLHQGFSLRIERSSLHFLHTRS